MNDISDHPYLFIYRTRPDLGMFELGQQIQIKRMSEGWTICIACRVEYSGHTDGTIDTIYCDWIPFPIGRCVFNDYHEARMGVNYAMDKMTEGYQAIKVMDKL